MDLRSNLETGTPKAKEENLRAEIGTLREKGGEPARRNWHTEGEGGTIESRNWYNDGESSGGGGELEKM